jgi:hypothetical protein
MPLKTVVCRHVYLSTLLKEPSIRFFNEQVKLRLELSVKIMLKPVSIRSPKHSAQITHRVLSSISSVFGCIVFNDLLWEAIGCCCLGQKLRLASMLQHGVQDCCFIDSSTDGQEAVTRVESVEREGESRRRCNSPMILQNTCDILLAQSPCNGLSFLCGQNNTAMIFINT